MILVLMSVGLSGHVKFFISVESPCLLETLAVSFCDICLMEIAIYDILYHICWWGMSVTIRVYGPSQPTEQY